MKKLWLGALLVAVAGCGDPESGDDRGYTKAPLEEPTVLVRGEPHSKMSELGDPILPVAPIHEPPEAGAADEKAPAGGGAPTAVPPGATAADVEAGQKIFAATGNCFTCHGQNGAGTGMGPALNDTQWLNADGSFEAIQTIVKNGVPQPKQHPAPMPAMGGASLTPEQVKQVAAYVYSMSR